ncbi:hypothetical protein ACLOJK_023707 [Asimina triloba]
MIIQSCNQTPHPEICNSIIPTRHLHKKKKTQLGFRHSLLQAALDWAIWEHRLASLVEIPSLDLESRVAWADCMELSVDTIKLLNRSLLSTNPKSFHDVQTWLSAAVANQRTCRDGFSELNRSPPSFPSSFASSLLPELLVNSLAANKAAISSRVLIRGRGHQLPPKRYPPWISRGDRKLLGRLNIAWKADVVVAKDGLGNYSTISEAVAASKMQMSGDKRFVIFVKAGIYDENVEIDSEMRNVMFIGEGMDYTVVTGNRSVQDGLMTTFRTATFTVAGEGFMARDMTFQNTAGPQKHQAVALRSSSDRSIFYRCSFKGYQDTLYLHSQRQFYHHCRIYGTVDFIFGDAAAILHSCDIYVRRPMIFQANIVTAQGRSDPNENTGIAIQDSRVEATPELLRVQGSFNTYLGRPWGEHSRTVFMKTHLGGLIHPAGWVGWVGDFGLRTLFFGEYMNTGHGARTGSRVRWPGRVVMNASQAEEFTPTRLLHGDGWIRAAGF